jgi:L-ascorbate metabolism protein UlaG (beta-lactamase superfamily)
MEIVFLGHSSFRIKFKKAVVVTDPYGDSIGLKLPKVTADLVTISHDHEDHNFSAGVLGTKDHPEPFVVAGPGEYEVSQVFVLGFSSYHDSVKGKERGKNTIYLLRSEGLTLCHLGDLGHVPSRKIIERLNQVDVLFIPVGGTYTLGPKEAAAVVAQIEPKVVIPMHYQLTGLNLKLASAEDFLAEIGIKKEVEEKLFLKSSEGLLEERRVVVLKSKNK